MSEEATSEGTEVAETAESTQDQQVTTPDPYEAKARELGWRPLDDFEGEPEGFVDAKEFIKRAPLFEKIKHQGKKLRDQERAIQDMADHVRKVEEAAYKRAITDLQREKREAVEQADHDRVQEIDEQIDEVRTQMTPSPTQGKIDPAIADWLSDKGNAWYHSDKKMKAFANGIHGTLLADGMGMEESLAEVTKMVKKAFPDKFTNPNRRAAPPVESASTVAGGKKTFTYRDLSDEQRKVADRFARMGIMAKDDYIKQLADNGLIGGH